MRQNKFGEIIFSESDLCDLIMRGHDVRAVHELKVEENIDLEAMVRAIDNPSGLMTWTFPEGSDISVPEFDRAQQDHWFMPDSYKNMDIAKIVLDLCETDAELQRCGQELLMFQERNMMDLLKYLKYLVDVMKSNHVIWGVGRGSSVASYVLYKLGVHRIDSMYYELDPGEFLR